MAAYDDDANAKLKQFVADAKTLRGDKIIVVDVRGNGGGNSAPAQQWIEELTGVRVPSMPQQFLASDGNIAHLQNVRDGYAAMENAKDAVAYFEQLLECAKANRGQLTTCTSAPAAPETGPYLFNGWIIVLTDAWCFSSAEIFIEQLKSLRRTIQAGVATDASTIYGDVRFDFPPSKRFFFTVPTKVMPFPGGRKSGEPIYPEVALQYEVKRELEGFDTLAEALERWIKDNEQRLDR